MVKPPSNIPHLYLRGKNFVFRLVIPTHLRSLAGKSEFKTSFKTKDFTLALKKYGEAEPYYQSLMRKLRHDESLAASSDLSYEVRMAAMQGRTYKPIDELIKKPNDFMQTYSDWSNRAKLHYSGY